MNGNALSARLMRMGVVVVVILLSLYFSYHAIYGAQGIRRHQMLEKEVAAKQAELKKLQGERMALEKRTGGLRPESIDPDMLDEVARKQLGFGKDGERVILIPK